MPDPVASLEWKVEEAARRWLLDVATHLITLNCDVRHHEADLNDENLDGSPKVPAVAFPVIILKAARIKQLTPGYDVTLFRLETHLWVSGDDVPDGYLQTPEQLYQELAKARQDIIMWDELAVNLSSKLQDFHVHAIQEFAPSLKTVVDRHWIHRLDVLLWAQPEAG